MSRHGTAQNHDLQIVPPEGFLGGVMRVPEKLCMLSV